MKHMKKIFQFLFQVLAICGFIAGIYYLFQKYILNNSSSQEEDEDCFDDFEFDDEDFTETASDTREYVTLNSSESKTVPTDDSFDEISD